MGEPRAVWERLSHAGWNEVALAGVYEFCWEELLVVGQLSFGKGLELRSAMARADLQQSLSNRAFAQRPQRFLQGWGWNRRYGWNGNRCWRRHLLLGGPRDFSGAWRNWRMASPERNWKAQSGIGSGLMLPACYPGDLGWGPLLWKMATGFWTEHSERGTMATYIPDGQVSPEVRQMVGRQSFTQEEAYTSDIRNPPLRLLRVRPPRCLEGCNLVWGEGIGGSNHRRLGQLPAGTRSDGGGDLEAGAEPSAAHGWIVAEGRFAEGSAFAEWGDARKAYDSSLPHLCSAGGARRDRWYWDRGRRWGRSRADGV